MSQVAAINYIAGRASHAVVESGQPLVSRCQAPPITYVQSLRLLGTLYRLRFLLIFLDRMYSILRTSMDRLDPKTEAAKWGEKATKLYVIHDAWMKDVLPQLTKGGSRIAGLGSTIARNLEDLGVVAEDMAETLALAASDQFTQLVEQELIDSRCAPERSAVK